MKLLSPCKKCWGPYKNILNGNRRELFKEEKGIQEKPLRITWAFWTRIKAITNRLKN